MKKTIKIVFVSMLLVILGACGSKAPTEVPEDNNLLSGKHTVEIKVKDMGSIEVEIDADIAPITATNFIKLTKDGFYDGLTFHRILSGFMIQGGDPNGDGTGGSKDTIVGEFSQNGYENNLLHTRGVISMARSNDKDSASSQFFIMHGDSSHLDGSYAAFGKVTKGMDIVDKIATSAKPAGDDGFVEKAQQPIIEKISVKE